MSIMNRDEGRPPPQFRSDSNDDKVDPNIFFKLLFSAEPFLYGIHANISVMVQLCDRCYSTPMNWCEIAFRIKYPRFSCPGWLWLIHKYFCKQNINETINFLDYLVSDIDFERITKEAMEESAKKKAELQSRSEIKGQIGGDNNNSDDDKDNSDDDKESFLKISTPKLTPTNDKVKNNQIFDDNDNDDDGDDGDNNNENSPSNSNRNDVSDSE